jgi:hypothetical protein
LLLACFATQRRGRLYEQPKDDRAIIAGQLDQIGLGDQPPSSISWRVRSRRFTCHARVSCRARFV